MKYFYNDTPEQAVARTEIEQLENWFNNYYRCQIEQYQRCVRLGIEFDKDIVELDTQAMKNQARIAELRKFLAEGNN
jgi:hypothetical protein